MTTIRECKPGDIIIGSADTYGEILNFFNLVSYDSGVIATTVCKVRDQDGVIKHLHDSQLDWECTVADALCEDCGKPVISTENGIVDAETGIAYCFTCEQKAEDAVHDEIAVDLDAMRELQAEYDAFRNSPTYDRGESYDLTADVEEAAPF